MGEGLLRVMGAAANPAMYTYMHVGCGWTGAYWTTSCAVLKHLWNAGEFNNLSLCCICRSCGAQLQCLVLTSITTVAWSKVRNFYGNAHALNLASQCTRPCCNFNGTEQASLMLVVIVSLSFVL